MEEKNKYSLEGFEDHNLHYVIMRLEGAMVWEVQDLEPSVSVEI